MPQVINKKAVADSFSKAASHYDQFAQLQRDIGDQLIDGISVQLPAKVIDLGCGTGYFSEKLSTLFPHTSLTCFDLSVEMLTQAKKRNIDDANFQQGDIDYLPFHKNSVDLIYSNLVVQWSADLASCLNQIKNSLKEGGVFHFSTLLDGTLDELTQAWKVVDNNPHTNRFLSKEIIESILKSIGFSAVKIKTETKVLQYENVIEVMRALKGIGANHVHGHKTQKVTGRNLIKQLEAGYQPYKNSDGRLNLTYQVCYIEVIK
ncbi:MAG: malonyl-ACP O-methyltransferase BioC [Alteromonadales bacterium]|nr:malonyl-ACP O-methyltransferase BioC [Alteromonadales bacterium]